MNVLLLGAVLSLDSGLFGHSSHSLIYLYSPVKHQDLKALVGALST